MWTCKYKCKHCHLGFFFEVMTSYAWFKNHRYKPYLYLETSLSQE